MHYLKRNSLLSIAFISVFLFVSLISSAALAGNGSGGGTNPPLLQSACLAAVSSNVSAASAQLGENMKLADNPPTIRLQFATNIADSTVWTNNQNYVTLYNGSHSMVPVNVSRIDPKVNFSERNYIFVTPATALAPGSYTIAIGAGLTSKNGISAGKEQSVGFSIAGDTGNNNNNGTGNNSDNNTSGNDNENNNNKDNSNGVVLTDINGHWAQSDISKLVDSGVIYGYPDRTFKPERVISRAEFVTIIVHAFNLEPKNGKVFEDTSNHWARSYIATAAGYGIVSGYNSTNFGPNDSLTREQMAVIIDKALKLNSTAGGKTFSDQAEISAWAKDAVIRANQNGILSGYPDNSFRPGLKATRAQAAVTVVNALNK
ncbi:MAG TPA: S-layer homology domain-containing protein [Syntrophomonadaceae bacterium]|nr:S-layer homology domain-containing protein [Syntrophomonadaceae bacterium]